MRFSEISIPRFESLMFFLIPIITTCLPLPAGSSRSASLVQTVQPLVPHFNSGSTSTWTPPVDATPRVLHPLPPIFPAFERSRLASQRSHSAPPPVPLIRSRSPSLSFDVASVRSHSATPRSSASLNLRFTTSFQILDSPNLPSAPSTHSVRDRFESPFPQSLESYWIISKI